MSQIFDGLDWQILINYDENPFQSFNNIAEALNVHHSTVSNRIKEMKTKKILREDIPNYHDIVFQQDAKLLEFVSPSDKGIRTKTEVIGQYNPWHIGLQRIHIIFKRIGSKEDFDRLWNFLGEHPYTHYMARLFGNGLNLYTQLDIPPSTIELHMKTFEIIKNEHYIDYESIEIFEFPNFFRYKPDYEVLQRQNEENHLDLLELFYQTVDKLDPFNYQQEIRQPDFDDIDARLIRELTINGKVKLKDISNYYETSLSTLSRRFAKIKENYVPNGALVFGDHADKLLGFNNTQIITGKFQHGSSLDGDSFFRFLNQHELPFETFLTVQEDRFLIYTQATAGMAGQLMEFFLEETEPYNLQQYQFYLNKSATYPFYNGNYHKDTGYNTDNEYILDIPLQIISH